MGKAAIVLAAWGLWLAPAWAAETGVVQGVVTDEDGEPVAAWVTFPEGDQPASATSPKNGQYEIELPVGSYLVEFSAAGYAPSVRPVRSRPGETAIYDVQLKKYSPAAVLKGGLENHEGKPVAGVISFVEPQRSAIAANPESGRYQDRVSPGTYKVLVSAAGYENVETDFTAKPREEIEMNFVLAPREGLNKIAVTEKAIEIKEKILFATGKHEVLFSSYPVLDEIFMVLEENPHLKLSIEGHTDSVGNAEANLELSQKRAGSVLQYLVDRGVAKERLKSVGYGLEKPLASNDTAEGREKNRRVEFNIVTE